MLEAVVAEAIDVEMATNIAEAVGGDMDVVARQAVHLADEVAPFAAQHEVALHHEVVAVGMHLRKWYQRLQRIGQATVAAEEEARQLARVEHIEVQIGIVRRIQGLRATVVEDVEVHRLRDLPFQETEIAEHRLVHPMGHQDGAVLMLLLNHQNLYLNNSLIFLRRLQPQSSLT